MGFRKTANTGVRNIILGPLTKHPKIQGFRLVLQKLADFKINRKVEGFFFFFTQTRVSLCNKINYGLRSCCYCCKTVWFWKELCLRCTFCRPCNWKFECCCLDQINSFAEQTFTGMLFHVQNYVHTDLAQLKVWEPCQNGQSVIYSAISQEKTAWKSRWSAQC